MWPRVNGMRTLELGTPGGLRGELNALVLAGTKTATASLLAEYAEEGEELESPGERLALLDDHGAVLAELRVTAVTTVAFGEVPWEFAEAEGEGYADLDHWRRAHLRYWQETEGRRVDETTPVVCMHFTRTIDPRDRTAAERY
ncbi:ASCH domain-containing protein [Saccharopolyspora elongata]|uniref:ASCH domain-containing protein n=1 Tax=Saccharopolyspora elongata TaxID=2530387 RepID=A0A4R4Z576_9PSEU|nr:ASCH domain-containing protein [Saccharopolyspora elongata]TDD53321.1 ASCH domain-containing protein [Saccharopolyspora elongata]